MLARLRELKTFYLHEVRHLLRDRHTLIYSVLIPIFLYPAVLLALVQAMSLVSGWSERQISRVLFPASGEHPVLRRVLEESDRLRLVELDDDRPDSRAMLAERIRRREAEVALVTRGRLLSGEPLTVDILYTSGRGESVIARDRLRDAARLLRDRVLVRMVLDAGGDPDLISILDVDMVDTASLEKKANHALSLILPLLMVVIIVMGAFYPALDCTAGERERRTLETTLVTPVARSTIVLGKYLGVVTMALMAFTFNLASMTFALKHLLIQLNVHSFALSSSSIALVITGGVLLSGLLGALLVAVAFMARSFKEGQSYLTPVYAVVLVPMAVTLAPDAELSAGLALIPLLNVTLLFRETLREAAAASHVILVLGSSAIYTILALWGAVVIVSRESFLLGDDGGVGCRIRSALRGGKTT